LNVGISTDIKFLIFYRMSPDLCLLQWLLYFDIFPWFNASVFFPVVFVLHIFPLINDHCIWVFPGVPNTMSCIQCHALHYVFHVPHSTLHIQCHALHYACQFCVDSECVTLGWRQTLWMGWPLIDTAFTGLAIDSTILCYFITHFKFMTLYNYYYYKIYLTKIKCKLISFRISDIEH